MANNFDKFFAEVLKSEGVKFEDVPGDSGGPTRCGITIYDVARWNNVKCPRRGAHGWDDLTNKVRALTPESAHDIYKRYYWDDVRAEELPSGLDYAVADYATNSGESKAIKTLGSLVGVAGSKITDEMIAAANAYGSLPDLINHYQDARKAFLEQISEIPHNTKFRRGWLDRVQRVRVAALEMAAVEPPQPAVNAMPRAVDPSDTIDAFVPPSKASVAAGSTSVWLGFGTILTIIANAFQSAKDWLGNFFDAAFQLLPQAVGASTEITSALQSFGGMIRADMTWILAAVGIAAALRFIVRHVDLKHGTVIEGITK